MRRAIVIGRTFKACHAAYFLRLIFSATPAKITPTRITNTTTIKPTLTRHRVYQPALLLSQDTFPAGAATPAWPTNPTRDSLSGRKMCASLEPLSWDERYRRSCYPTRSLPTHALLELPPHRSHQKIDYFAELLANRLLSHTTLSHWMNYQISGQDLLLLLCRRVLHHI